MTDDTALLSPTDRAALERVARSLHTAHGVAVRARLVLDCADLGPTEAARRSSVSQATAAKWWRRYRDAGIDGLRDVPHTGRPPASDEIVRRVLRCTLDEPPVGTQRWSTRAIADATGVSQASVSRIRRRCFPNLAPEAAFLQDFSTSTLVYVDVQADGCAIGFHASGIAAGRPAEAPPARVEAVETIVCAPLLRPLDRATGDAVAVLERAARRLPAVPTVTLVIDTELDAVARQWLSRHPELTVHTATGERWLAMLAWIANSIDAAQLAELREVQRLIRQAHQDSAGEFVWCRTTTSAQRTTSVAATEPPAGDLSHVVRGICTAISRGELQAGEPIAPRRIARRSGVSPGRVAEALAHLTEEALIERDAGRYRVPVPTTRDVIETYTARGLLGTAIARRLASTRSDLPPVVDEQFAGLIRCDELALPLDACEIDLDLQDELARAARHATHRIDVHPPDAPTPTVHRDLRPELQLSDRRDRRRRRIDSHADPRARPRGGCRGMAQQDRQLRTLHAGAAALSRTNAILTRAARPVDDQRRRWTDSPGIPATQGVSAVQTIALSAEDIRRAVPMADAIDAVRAGFAALARGEFEMPTRTALRDGQFLVMSVHHAPTASAVIKTLSLNFGGRQPAIVGTVTWSDLSRTDHLIADAGAVTALRTGAASGLATDLLAKPDASALTVIGAGGQAADQVRAVHTVRPLRRLTLVDHSVERAGALARELAAELPGVDITVESDADVAVRDAEIVCCATTATEPLFALASLPPQVHVNAIGAFRPTMRELPDELLADAGTVYIDERAAILEESGEIIHALQTGAITEAALTEIGTVNAPVRGGRTVFKTVGVAVQDWAIARRLAEVCGGA